MDLIDKYIGEKKDFNHSKAYGSGSKEFVHLYKDQDGWNVVHSIHNTPQMGGQVLKSFDDETEAKKLAEKLAKKWGATLSKWIKKGMGRFVSA